VFSPDGSKIAFQSFRDNPDPPAPEIYTMNPDGSGQTRLTNNPEGNADPAFSPDESKIAFTSGRNRNFDDENRSNIEIYSMNADGRAQTRLTVHPSVDLEPVFSPDGSRVAFRSIRRVASEQFSTMDAADGSGVVQLTDLPGGTKLLNDWGVRSSASLDPPPSSTTPPLSTNPPPPAGSGCLAGTSAGVRCRSSSGGGLVITGTARNDRIVGSPGDDTSLRRRQRHRDRGSRR
jgi:hypothetical protein